MGTLIIGNPNQSFVKFGSFVRLDLEPLLYKGCDPEDDDLPPTSQAEGKKRASLFSRDSDASMHQSELDRQGTPEYEDIDSHTAKPRGRAESETAKPRARAESCSSSGE